MVSRDTPSPCEQTHTCKNITFPILRMQVVNIEEYHKKEMCQYLIFFWTDIFPDIFFTFFNSFDSNSHADGYLQMELFLYFLCKYLTIQKFCSGGTCGLFNYMYESFGLFIMTGPIGDPCKGTRNQFSPLFCS